MCCADQSDVGYISQIPLGLQELVVILLDVGELMKDALPYAGQALRAMVLNKVSELSQLLR